MRCLVTLCEFRFILWDLWGILASVEACTSQRAALPVSLCMLHGSRLQLLQAHIAATNVSVQVPSQLC